MSRTGGFAVSRKLIGISKAIAEATNLEVVFKGGVPQTDGKVLILPNIVADVNQDVFDLYVGYINHEAGHILYSEFDPGKRHRTTMNVMARVHDFFKFDPSINLTQNFILKIENFVEDLVVEHKIKNKYKGSQHYLVRLCEVALARLAEAQKDKQDPYNYLSTLQSKRSKSIMAAIDAGYLINFPGRENLINDVRYKKLAADDPDFEIIRKAVDPVFKQIAKDPDSRKNEDRVVEIIRRLAKALQSIIDKENQQQQQQKNQQQNCQQGSGSGSNSSGGGKQNKDAIFQKEVEKPTPSKGSGKKENPQPTEEEEEEQDNSGGESEGQNPKPQNTDGEEADDAEEEEVDAEDGDDQDDTDLKEHESESSGAGGGGLSQADKKLAQQLNDVSNTCEYGDNSIAKAVEQVLSSVTDKHVDAEKNFGIDTPMTLFNSKPMPPLDFKKAKDASADFKRTFVNQFLSFQTKTRKTHQPEGVLDIKRAGRLMMAADTNVFKLEKKFKRVNTAVHMSIDISGSMSALVPTVRKIAYAMADALKSTNVSFSLSVYNDRMKIIKKDRERLTPGMMQWITACGGTNLERAILTAGKYLLSLKKDRNIIIAITDGCVSHSVQPIDRLLRSNDIEVFYVLIDKNIDSARQMKISSPIDQSRAVAFGGDFTKEFFKELYTLLKTGVLDGTKEKSTIGGSAA